MIWSVIAVFLGLVFSEYVKADGNVRNWTEIVENREAHLYTHVSHLGDIALTEEQERNAMNWNYYPNSKWPEGQVPVVFGENEFSREDENTILSALVDLNRRLRDYGAKARVVDGRNSRDRVKIVSRNGCWSYMGKIGGDQLLSLGPGCVYQKIVQHEMMHAMGIGHEQTRHDRDDNVDILWDNIPDRWKSQYEKADNSYWDIGDYDFYSIMHYGLYAPDSGWKEAFRVKKGGINKNWLGNGENDGATQADLWKLYVLYYY